MVFSSVYFLFAFLPLVLILSIGLKVKWQNILLLLSSIYFYAWGSVSHLLILVFSILANYFLGLGIHRLEGKRRKWMLFSTVGFNILLLGGFKYVNFAVENLSRVYHKFGGDTFSIGKIALPIGISFFTFQILSYQIDLYRKQVKVQRNVLRLGMYISLFPQLVAGPIVRYSDVEEQMNERSTTVSKFYDGIKRFTIGLAKKVLIANHFAFIADTIFDMPFYEVSSLTAWIGIIAYTIQIYFDFSGYSDMAIGLGKMVGFDFPENFNLPYTARSIQDFWRRWHISLSTWFKDYLYIPLGGSKNGQVKTIRNLLIVFFITGLWHGANWTFIFWGMFHGTFLLIERIGFGKILQRLPGIVQWGYAFFVVVIAWVFFKSDSIDQAIHYLGRMFGMTDPPTNFFSVFTLISWKTIVLTGIACFSAFGFHRKIQQLLPKKETVSIFQLSLQSVMILGLFLVSIVYLTAGTYNPFIYFRF